jgi:hypothetical protein
MALMVVPDNRVAEVTELLRQPPRRQPLISSILQQILQNQQQVNVSNPVLVGSLSVDSKQQVQQNIQQSTKEQPLVRSGRKYEYGPTIRDCIDAAIKQHS